MNGAANARDVRREGRGPWRRKRSARVLVADRPTGHRRPLGETGRSRRHADDVGRDVHDRREWLVGVGRAVFDLTVEVAADAVRAVGMTDGAERALVPRAVEVDRTIDGPHGDGDQRSRRAERNGRDREREGLRHRDAEPMDGGVEGKGSRAAGASTCGDRGLRHRDTTGPCTIEGHRRVSGVGDRPHRDGDGVVHDARARVEHRLGRRQDRAVSGLVKIDDVGQITDGVARDRQGPTVEIGDDRGGLWDRLRRHRELDALARGDARARGSHVIEAIGERRSEAERSIPGVRDGDLLRRRVRTAAHEAEVERTGAREDDTIQARGEHPASRG